MNIEKELKQKKDGKTIAVIIHKSIYAIPLAFVASNASFAALPANDTTTTLDFNDGSYVCNAGAGTYPDCAYGTNVPTGSYFGMDTSGNQAIENGEKVAISSAGTGFVVGVPQAIGEIDNQWQFGGNPGYHHTNADSGITVPSVDASGNIDMRGWTVNWNGGDIDMGQGTNGTDYTATINCTPVDCSDGASFTLDYAAIVPTGSFAGFYYTLYLEGTIVDTNNAPVASDGAASLAVNSSTTVDVTALVTDAEGNGTIDFTSVTFQTNTCSSATTTNNNGVITVTDNSGTQETCSFQYQVADEEGMLSNWATVNVTIASNPPPVANADSATTQQNTVVIIDVLANDTDDSAIEPTTVAATDGSNGTTSVNATTGQVTYTPDTGFTGSDTFTYTVDDDLGATSNTATVTVSVNAAPTANNNTANVNRNSSVDINVLANDSDSFGGSIDPTTVIASNATNGTVSVNGTTGFVTFTPTIGYIGVGSFTYTVEDTLGAISNEANVTVNVNNNPPVASNDSTSLDASTTGSVNIAVADNDVDPDGTLSLSTITIISDASSGSTLVSPTSGVVTYTPDSGFTGTDNFTYTINDNDGDTSNIATVSISVSNSASSVLDPAAYLIFDSGTLGSGVIYNDPNRPAVGNGSWFSMALNPGTVTVTSLTAKNGVQLGTIQSGYSGGSSAPAETNIDELWLFAGNSGVHQTTSAVEILTDDGQGNVTLDFSGWDVSWNSLASIPMGDGQDNGIATMSCDVDCSEGDRFVLDYHAIVPPGDPSGFGGVNYTLHLEGVISLTQALLGGGDASLPYDVTDIAANETSIVIVPGEYATATGNTSGTGLSITDIGISDPLMNPDDGEACIGGCFDISISGLTGEYVDLVIRLNAPIPQGARLRKLIDNRWTTFSTSGGDLVGSANTDASGNCQGPDGVFSPGLTTGAQCLYLRIHDGGLNDADHTVNGTVVDPSGIMVAGSPNSPLGATDGCSMTGDIRKANHHADWWLLACFITLLGWLKLSHRKA